LIYLQILGNKYNFNMATGGYSNTPPYLSIPDDRDNWHQIVITRTNTPTDHYYPFTIYLDGIKSGRSALNITNNLPFIIGGNSSIGHVGYNVSFERYKGEIANFMVYNRTLNESEVAGIFNEQISEFYYTKIYKD
jgi:hypothetical protein